MGVWAGQQVLPLLQDLFKQGKLSLMLTLTWGDCKGSCNDYNWDSWAPCIALHASRNVVQRLKHLETIQVIEHCAVVNACKKGANSYCWSQVTTVFIRKTTKSPYILYGTPLKFYPSLRTWPHHASRPLCDCWPFSACADRFQLCTLAYWPTFWFLYTGPVWNPVDQLIIQLNGLQTSSNIGAYKCQSGKPTCT